MAAPAAVLIVFFTEGPTEWKVACLHAVCRQRHLKRFSQFIALEITQQQSLGKKSSFICAPQICHAGAREVLPWGGAWLVYQPGG